MKKIILLLAATALISCGKENKTQEIGERFFENYSKRKEIDKMVSFYAKDFHYENIGFESEADDPRFLYKDFYGWADAGFVFSNPETIKLDEIVTSDSTIVAKGKFLPHSYNNRAVEEMRFVIWLELDKDLKIKKQTDWFDYPMTEIIEAFYLKQNMKVE